MMPESATTATRKEFQRTSRRNAEVEFSLASNTVDFFFDRQRIQACERQAGKQTDAPLKHDECVTKCPRNLFPRSGDRCRVGDPPMGCHRLTGPNLADFRGGVVADREDKVQLRGSWLDELLACLASHFVGGLTGVFEFLG